MPLKIFCSYAHQDEKRLIELKKHLSPLQRHGFIELWYDRNISAGTEWEKEIDKNLNSAQIILLMISADFMASDYCYGKEMKLALEKHDRGQARVIPIIIRSVKWQYEAFSKLQALPTDGKAVNTWPDKDRAFKDITEGIAQVIEELSTPELLESPQQPQKTHLKRKKALLVLTGGRPLPDILTLLYMKPELVVIIAPQEGWQSQKIIVDVASTLPSCEVQIVGNDNVYSLDSSIQTYIEACSPYSETEWEWTFTVSSATKVMALAGYELAKQKDIACWQVDPLHETVLSLIKETKIDTQQFFRLSISTYISTFGYSMSTPATVAYEYQSNIEFWANIAQELLYAPDSEEVLSFLRGEKIGDNFIPRELEDSTLLQLLENKGLIEIKKNNVNKLTCHFSSPSSIYFLRGGWLEFYVFNEVKKANFAEDYQYSFRISKGNAVFEIDFALMYKARLLITDCCISKDTFMHDTHLARLDSITNLLGGNYVRKIFVTNRSKAHRSYQLFCERATLRGITVITKEDLPNIGNILKNEMVSPTHARI